MCSRSLSLLLLCSGLASVACGQQVLRVCADPNNLPLSNQAGEGFENKLAELLASTLGARLEYTWWSERKSFIKNSLDQGRCDVLTGVPSSLDSVAVTKPYYRSSYVFVSRRDRGLRITSLLDERLSSLRIGVHVVGDDYAPPALVLARRGITRNIVGFSLFGESGELDPARKIIDAVSRGTVDLAIVWGPLAGYYAKAARPELDVEPVSPAVFAGIPFAYDISMAVRKGDDALRAALDNALQSQSTAIRQILDSYGVPQ